MIPIISAIEYQHVIDVNSNESVLLVESYEGNVILFLLRHVIGKIFFILSEISLISTIIVYLLGVFLLNFHQFTIGLGITCYFISIVAGTLSLPLLLLASIIAPFIGYQDLIGAYIIVLFCWLIIMYILEGYESIGQFISDLINTIKSIFTPNNINQAFIKTY